jgi:HK97 family phage major capsid protein
MLKSLKIVKFLLAMFAFAVMLAFMAVPSAEGAFSLIVAAPLVLAAIENSTHAKQKRSDIWDEMQSMLQLRKNENRAFTDDEQKRYDGLESDWDNLTAHIKKLEADEKRALEMAGTKARQSAQEKEQKQLARYSFQRAMSFALNNRAFDGLEAEMDQEARREMEYAKTPKAVEGFGVPSVVFRAMTATGQTSAAGDQGGNWIPKELSGLMLALRDRLVLAQLGARFMGGLSGNIDFPKGGLVTASWATENANNTSDASPGTSVISISPKRLTALVKYSRQLLAQASPDVEAYLINELLSAVARGIEGAAIVGGGSNQPVGLLSTANVTTVPIGTDGGAPTWAHIIGLESAVASANADMGALGYLTNEKVRGKLKATPKASNYPSFVFESGPNPINGYAAGITNLVPSNGTKANGTALSSIVFGNFNDLVIGNWGGMDVVVDPYTAKTSGMVEIAANTYWDAKVLRTESFAKIIDAVTTA